MEVSSIFSALQFMISYLPGHAYLIDNKGKYQCCNDLLAKSFGLSDKNDIVGKSNTEIPILKNQSDLINQWNQNNKKVFNVGRPMLFDESFRNVNNDIIHCKNYKIPIFDNRNNIKLLFSISLDLNSINEPLLNEQISINNNLKKIINNLPGHVYWKDIHGKYLGCNLTQAINLGFSNPEELIGKTDYDLSEKKVADKFRAIDEEVIKQKREIESEEVILKDGKPATVLSKKIPLFNDDKEVVSILGISFDITDRKKTEEDERLIAKEKAEAANKAKGDFISNMEHDLRTPFSGISGAAHLLSSRYKDSSPELNQWLEIMITSCTQLEMIQNRIFDSLVVETSQAVQISPVSISKELHEIQDLMTATLKIKQLECVIDPIPLAYDIIQTDALKFRLILSSLMSNAVNFTEQGRIHVTVTREDEQYIIRIADTGIGIPADKFDYIFEKFTKLSRSNRYGSHFKGVGLGLYIAQQYAQQLGGCIQVTSQLGKGSCFTVKLPSSKAI